MHTQHNYVISVKNNTQRRNHIISEFGKQNIPFEFFDAITPDLIEVKAKEFDLDLSNSTLTKGEIACALSHIALWHFAKAQNLDYICIFEDDIYLGENAIDFLSNSYVNENVDIIKLEKHYARIKYKSNPDVIFKNRQLHRLKLKHMGAAGYVLTKKGLTFLLDKLKGYQLLRAIDDLMFDKLLKEPEYNVLQLIPAICIQDYVLNNNITFSSELANERDKRRRNISVLSKLHRELIRPFYQLNKRLFGRDLEFK